VVALLPVLVFLLLLVAFDSFKLVPTWTLAKAILAGAGAAGVAWMLHGWLVANSALDPVTYLRYVAPFTEVLKALFVVCILHRRRSVSG
jgi:L-cystine uptake protein TcyP (sodium:dicarboxylate symporter family)